jgi:molecular chaperone HtpG
LHLTDECSEFLEDYRIKTLVRKYADYLPTPIMMTKKPEVKKDADGNEIVEEGTPEVMREQINKTKAIRQKMKKDVTPEEYKEHFGSLAYASDHPLDVIHVSVE